MGGHGEGTAFLRFVRNDHLYQDYAELDRPAARLRDAWREVLTTGLPRGHRAMSRRDVVLINTGAHWTHRRADAPDEHAEVGYFYEHTVAQMRALMLANSIALREAGFQGTLLMRTLVPGHARCETLFGPLSKRQPRARLPFNWRDFEDMNGPAAGAHEGS